MYNRIVAISLYLTSALCHAQGSGRVSDQDCKVYLDQHWQSPEKYIVGKFQRYDVVLLGEFHRIKHDVALVQTLIPLLYQAGVYTVGIEFGESDYQPRVDSVLNAENYDESAVRAMMRNWYVHWGYQDYEDIYRKAWEFNQSLPRGARKFRVVNLNSNENAKELAVRTSPQAIPQAGLEAEQHMADVVSKEILLKGEKALIYCGSNHAVTKYHTPGYDSTFTHLVPSTKNRLGNLIEEQIPGRTFFIFLHSPWTSRDLKSILLPVHGVIDTLMQKYQEQRVGFDVIGTPFARLRDDSTVYAIGSDNFELGKFCDGYIFQKPISNYEGCTVDTLFLSGIDPNRLFDIFPNLDKGQFSPAVFYAELANDVRFDRQFAGIK